MTSSESVLHFATLIALGLFSLAFFLTVYRIIIGPTLPDRVLGLDMLVAIAIGFIAVIGIKTGFTLYLDIAIALGLVGFLATVAFARFILQRASANTEVELPKHARLNTAAVKKGLSDNA